MNLAPDTSLAVTQASQGMATDKINAMKKALSDKELARIDETAKDFEAMFVSEMMKPMFEGIKPDERFGGGKTEEVFKGVLLQEYGKLMAETGTLGIAESVKAELIRMQSNTLEIDNNGGITDAE
ncbi:MAG: flagellar biosynthesis protein FlgJ [Alphaproteobacteria bacterium]|nr:flagellar biosynthesis protein FlgJ [Alphaproteobacteria bacterium]NCQ87582.1 flagellar biosynthesis protein FlgJ [Alphaproteobacteria bacterium]NCT06451.1 flagellar biosynthesis protein FlgJ [Alphaproteobacteria bacterium]